MESYLKYKDAKKKISGVLHRHWGWDLGGDLGEFIRELPDPSLEIYYLTQIWLIKTNKFPCYQIYFSFDPNFSQFHIPFQLASAKSADLFKNFF